MDILICNTYDQQNAQNRCLKTRRSVLGYEIMQKIKLTKIWSLSQ